MSSNVVAVRESAPMSVASLRERSQHVQALIKDLMVEDVHYMVIPGTKNRSLTKQGSEMLLSAFHISVEPQVEDKSDADAVRFTVRAIGTHMSSGIIVGVGIGRCSSNEEKYKWRRAVCVEEFEATPEERRRIKWGSSERGAYTQQQIRTNPEDVANTVLKMAKKRAQADLCLTALAASDAFRPQPKPQTGGGGASQPRSQGSAAPAASAAGTPKREPDPRAGTPGPQDQLQGTGPQGPRPATSAQLGLLRRKLDQSGIPENHFFAQFELGRLEDLAFDRVDAALKWIQDLMEPAGQ